jgi:hypothetical protein
MASHKRLQLFMAWLSSLFGPATGLILPPGTSLIHVEGMIPTGFRCGLEILNDDKTPMLFVVSVLRTRVSLSKQGAHRTMLAIHARGRNTSTDAVVGRVATHCGRSHRGRHEEPSSIGV